MHTGSSNENELRNTAREMLVESQGEQVDRETAESLARIVRLLRTMETTNEKLSKTKKEQIERLGAARAKLREYIESCREQISPDVALDLIAVSWQEVLESEDGYKTLVGEWRDVLRDLKARLRKALDDNRQMTLTFDVDE